MSLETVLKKQLVGGAQGLTDIAEPSSNNAGTQKLAKVQKKIKKESHNQTF